MDEKRKRKQIAKISVFVTSIFVIFLSITYAFINMTVTGTKRQVITSGNLQVELEEDNAITLTNAMPMYDEVGMIQDAFNFRLVNKTSEDTNYIVRLVDITDSSKEKLDTSIVKYGLTKDDETRINYLSNLFQERLDTGIIKGNQIIHYSLRLWIDESVIDNTLLMEKTLSFRVDVEVSQKIVLNPSGTLCPKSSSTCTLFQEYAPVTRFENKIDIPAGTLAENQWDVSEEQDGSVMSYIERDENGEATILHIQGNGGIYLPEDSSYLLSYLETIEGLEYLDASKVITMRGLFEKTTTENLDFSIIQWDTSKVTDMGSMFGASRIQNLSLVGLDTSNVIYMEDMFSGETYIQYLDLTGLDVSNVEDMSNMFSMATLEDVHLKIYDWDVSNVTSMNSMFSNVSMKSLDIRNFDAPQLDDVNLMFGGAKIETLNLSDSKFSSIIDTSEMFLHFKGINVNLSRIDFSNVTDMNSMFSCISVDEINLSDWNMPNVMQMISMFESGNIKKIHFDNWDTSSVTLMTHMFNGCSALTSLDLSHFDTLKVTDMSSMFSGCRDLMDLNISSFGGGNGVDIIGIFENLESLQKLDMSGFDANILEERDTGVMSVPTNCLIIVKDQAVKNYLESTGKNFTNIVIKNA